MPIYDIYSERQRRLRGDVPDVFTYDELPEPLKVQIVQIVTDALGDKDKYRYVDSAEVRDAYKSIVEILRREHGKFELAKSEFVKIMDIDGMNVIGGEICENFLEELVNYFMQETDVEKCMDVIELSFKKVESRFRTSSRSKKSYVKQADDAINELNDRFKKHGVGYQFVEGEIMRVDSELLHVEAVKPALRLLNGKEYKGAQEEFLAAYNHYRHGRHKEVLNDCLKSFESVMKAICDKRRWKYGNKPTAAALIKTCFDNGLIPPFWQRQLNSLHDTLSGIPTARNNLSAHGQGTTPMDVPDYLVAYVLHMTASALVFLTTAEKHLK